MIDIQYNIDFSLNNETNLKDWISSEISKRGYKEGDILYVFCSDEELLKINQEFLNHDTYTDIISFDYTMGKLISGEIYISIDRVQENAIAFGVPFEEELHRVMIHGILHFCGYKDSTESEQQIMRKEEDLALSRLI
ncbi:MAG: rRNA maturation RNase YbeY [Bacteroidetes bacterium]|jgi:rRNA maturation RNase YbeY|nr:rRNA maturation RNase YbeY [Bacteroidota bacterium]